MRGVKLCLRIIPQLVYGECALNMFYFLSLIQNSLLKTSNHKQNQSESKREQLKRCQMSPDCFYLLDQASY